MSERIFFGSIELQEKERLEKLANAGGQGSAVIPSKPSSSVIQAGEPEVLPFSERALETQRKYAALQQDFETKSRAKKAAVPTDDKLVQARLRELGEPIILFGEQPAQRRERLKDFLTKKGIDEGMPRIADYHPRLKEDDELFYTEGTPALRRARIWISRFSLPRAKERIEKEKRTKSVEDARYKSNGVGDHMEVEDEEEKLKQLYSSFNDFAVTSTQVDDRPICYCTFSPDGKTIATASWSGVCKVWNVSDSNLVHSMKGHLNKAACVVYHPFSGLSQENSAVNLASCGMDQTVNLWSLDQELPLSTLKGHTNRVNRVAFHPSGRYLGSTSTDLTWRLWDIETGKDLLEQEGHSREVFAISFQEDGSLVATGGEDCIGRVWDLRTGKSIYVLRGHCKKVTALDWHPNGYYVVTGSDDNSARVFDVRKRRAVFVIPAHTSLISQVKFHPDGELLLTSSFDNTIKLWSARDWSPVKTIKANENKIMCADISKDYQHIVTANYDLTWRLFTHDTSLI